MKGRGGRRCSYRNAGGRSDSRLAQQITPKSLKGSRKKQRQKGEGVSICYWGRRGSEKTCDEKKEGIQSR